MFVAAGTTVDLDAYLTRIGQTGAREPTLAVLEAVHLGHAAQIPFENLDILLGRPLRLDLEGLQAKLVAGHRGGYCFEQNTLLAAVLQQLGFHVTALAARVRLGAARIAPRTHMLLRVDIAGSAYLADVGFGGDCLLKPVPMVAGREFAQFGRVYRLMEDAGLWVLQARHGASWEDLYAFTQEPQYAIDYLVANHFTETHPSSIFRKQIFVQITRPEASYRLFDRKLSVRVGDEVESREIDDDEELLRVLAATFGLHFAPATRFPAAAPAA
jgi:N-hydroxyarylamine O-acetyltransferase